MGMVCSSCKRPMPEGTEPGTRCRAWTLSGKGQRPPCTGWAVDAVPTRDDRLTDMAVPLFMALSALIFGAAGFTMIIWAVAELVG